MKRALAIAVVVLVAAVVGWHSAREPKDPAAAPVVAAKDSKPDLPVASVLRVGPAQAPPAPTTSAPRQASIAESARLKQFHDGIDYESSSSTATPSTRRPSMRR